MSAPGGLALTGERGRELVALPRGSRVYPNHTTERILGGGGGPMDLSEETIARLAAAILAGAKLVSQATTAASWKDEMESIFT